MVDMLIDDAQKVRKNASYVRVRGVYMKQTPRAVLLFVDDAEFPEVWIPKRLAFDLTVVGEEHLALSWNDLEDEDEVVVSIPRWLARKERIRV